MSPFKIEAKAVFLGGESAVPFGQLLKRDRVIAVVVIGGKYVVNPP
jgi:hypothetical protein